MFERLDQIETKYQELNEALASRDTVSDSPRYQKTAQAHSELTPVVDRYREYKDLKRGIVDTKTLLVQEHDADLKAMPQEEPASLQAGLGRPEAALNVLSVP